MDQKIKFLVITITIICVVLAGLLATSMSQNFLFTSYARVTEGENQDDGVIWYVFDAETYLGDVFFRIEPSPTGLQQNQMTISLSLFYNQTELDFIKIRFSGGNSVISVYKEDSSYDWNYQFRMESGDITFEVPNLDWYGQSTTRLDFILVPFDATNLHLDMELLMHKTTPLQLTSLKAQVFIDTPIPQVTDLTKITESPTEPSIHKAIRDRIRVENTDEEFPDPENRVLDWYILRVENSSDYPQETTTYWLFWRGKELHGDIDAFAEIYNMPGNFTHYTLEITRFTCYELTVYVDDATVTTFPHIDDAYFNQTHLGYTNIEITI